MDTTNTANQIFEVACRIRDMREIAGFSVEEMARRTDTAPEEYARYEAGELDFPFTFIHKCALAFGIGMTDILEGRSANLSSYTVTRRGHAGFAAREDGIEIRNLAPRFRDNLAQPYWVRYEYSEAQQNRPIHMTTHSGQEFDYILSGKLKVQVGSHVELLEEGDSIYYDSSTPHGMIAIGGEDCVFCAVVMPGDKKVDEQQVRLSVATARLSEPLSVEKFVHPTEDAQGCLQKIDFENEESFNFAYDVVDAIADKNPDKLAMLHISRDMVERRFTFREMKRASNQCANYFKSLGIQSRRPRHARSEAALPVLVRNAGAAQARRNRDPRDESARRARFFLSLQCRGRQGDRLHRGRGHGASGRPGASRQPDAGAAHHGRRQTSRLARLRRGVPDVFRAISAVRPRMRPAASDTMLMFFTSGTTGYPKIAAHNYKYPLGHFITARYWHCVRSRRTASSRSPTPAGARRCGASSTASGCARRAVFVYDFDRFDATKILPMFAKYHITTFCAPPTMYRMLIKEDLSQYDLSSHRARHDRGRGAEPRGIPPVRNARRDCRSWRASARPRRR